MSERTPPPASGGSGAGGAASPGDRPPPDDPFSRGQRDAEALRRAVEGLREDVGALVREEVSRAGMSRSELERLVRDAVSREVRRAGPSGSPWRSVALAGVGVVVGLAAGVVGYRALAGPGDATPPAVEASSPAPAERAGGGSPGDAEAGEPGSPPGTTPDERAAVYDSLLDSRSERLEPLMARLEAAGPAVPVAEAVRTWRAGTALDAAGRRRLHDALVQLALNDEAGAGLALDGLLTRDPCRGNSCGALLELWRTRGEELGMPELPDEPASDTPTLGVAERVLVLGRLEAAGAEGGEPASGDAGERGGSGAG